MNLEKIKVLGTGMFGTTYLTIIDGKKYALKTQHILPVHRKKNYKYELWRELDLYKYIDKLSNNDKKFFTQLHSYNIYNNCKHKQKRPFKLKKEGSFFEEMTKLDKSSWCIDMLIDYHGKWTCGKYLTTHSITSKQCYSLIVQIFKIIDILYKGGYSHNDLHLDNVMMKKTNEKYFTYKNKRIPYRGYQLVAIDYGEVLHKKFKIKHAKKFKKDRDLFMYNEIKNTTYNLTTNFDKYLFNFKKKKFPWEGKINGFDNLTKKIIINHPDFWNKHKLEFITDDDTKKIIQKVEDNLDTPVKQIISKADDNTGAWDVVNRTSDIFRALYPKLHAKYTGWCSYHKLNIKKSEFIKMIKINTLKKLIKYVLNKV